MCTPFRCGFAPHELPMCLRCQRKAACIDRYSHCCVLGSGCVPMVGTWLVLEGVVHYMGHGPRSMSAALRGLRWRVNTNRESSGRAAVSLTAALTIYVTRSGICMSRTRPKKQKWGLLGCLDVVMEPAAACARGASLIAGVPWVGGGPHGGHDGGYPAPARVLSLQWRLRRLPMGGGRPSVPGTHHSGDLRGGAQLSRLAWAE